MMRRTRKLRRANKEEVMAVRHPHSMVLPINKVAMVNHKARTVSSMVDMASLLPARVDMVSKAVMDSNSKRVMVSSRAAMGDLQLDNRDSQAIHLSKVAGMGLLLLHHDINDCMLDLLIRSSHTVVVA
jgi:hypothetical protein